MLLDFAGALPSSLTAKDMILGAIGQVGIDGGVGYVVEYGGEAVTRLTMEQRMTICNMSIEWGARAGMIAPDDMTFAYLEGKEFTPAGTDWERALDDWRLLASDAGATFDAHVEIDIHELAPQVTWGTNPGMVVPVTGSGSRSRLRSRTPTTASRQAARSSTWGCARAGDRGHHHRPGLHRLVHELPHRGSPCRSRHRRRAQGRSAGDGARRARLRPGAPAG